MSHGLSDKEKKNASDNFELHLELRNSRNVAVVLIEFLFQKATLQPTVRQIAKMKSLRLSCGFRG